MSAPGINARQWVKSRFKREFAGNCAREAFGWSHLKSNQVSPLRADAAGMAASWERVYQDAGKCVACCTFEIAGFLAAHISAAKKTTAANRAHP
jgi:hypothetical protein